MQQVMGDSLLPLCMQTMRNCMELCNTDDERLSLYAELKAQLKGYVLTSYPSLELQWLVTHMWNRGSRLYKLGRTEQAFRLMAAAADLEDIRPGRQSEKEVVPCCDHRAQSLYNSPMMFVYAAGIVMQPVINAAAS